MRRLYHPEKYEVVIGKGSDGLCTAWSDPEMIVEKEPLLKKRFALIGHLYSRKGVEIMLRNLALNPDIRNLYLWASNPLSRTAFGSKGWKLLKKVFEGDFSALPESLDREVLGRVIRNVKLHDVSSLKLPELANLPASPSEPYMEPYEFKEEENRTDRAFPSEGAGFLARGKGLLDVWPKLISMVMRYGRIKGTEYGNRQKELSAVMWVIEELEIPEMPDWPDSLKSKTGISGWKDYLNAFLDREVPEGSSYTYGNRLRQFFGVDQVEWMKNKLISARHTRRAVAVTYYPPVDEKSSVPPCLNWMQFLERDGKLDMFAIFRSHDMFKAAIPNAISLIGLISWMSEQTGMEKGKLVITSYSAHIYEEDWDDAKRMSECYENSLPLDFSPERDADPRGNVVISVADRKITAELITDHGKMEISGKSAKEVAYRIARLGLLSSPLHYADIAMELQKAETAMKLGLGYKQDRPLKFME